MTSVSIPSRFNGPPDSGHGGYSCALAARFVDGPAEVTLRLPPPLETPMQVQQDGEHVRLLHGDAVVAEARPAQIDTQPPRAVGVDEARAAEPNSPFLLDTHPFPTCFACGPRRPAGDGMRIYAAPVEPGLYAAAWTPAADMEGEDFIWTALDCPSSSPIVEDLDGVKAPAVLGRLAVEVDRLHTPGEPHVIVAWGEQIDGRKIHTGVALTSASGDLLAVGRATWIRLRS